jgi:predicted phage terminase large subunit-like protein
MKKIKTFAQFEKEYRRLKSEILSRPAFDDNSTEAKKERLEKSKNDKWFFARTYFPEYVCDKNAPFHSEWEKISNIKNEPVMIITARGFGKSTFFTFIDLLHKICFAKSVYNLVSSYVEKKAKIFTGRILLELKYNSKLISDFGCFFADNSRQAIGYFVAKNKLYNTSICVHAISIGQDPRGLVFGPHRPTSINIDDPQSDKKAKSKKFVLEAVNWLLVKILPAMDKEYTCHICATFLNDRCFASILYKGDEDNGIPPVLTFIYPAEKKGKPTWANKFPEERLKKLKEKMGTANYNQEMLCIPKPIDGRIFDKSNMKYFSIVELMDKSFDMVISASDFSMTAKGDFKATVCLALIEGKYYVLQARIKRERLSQHIKGMYEIYNNCNPERMFFEDVTKDKTNISTVKEAFETVEKEIGFPLPYEALTNNENKIARIEATLSSPVENQKILFNKDDPDQKILIDQLYEFPDGENDDAPDALEMAVRKILEMSRRKVMLPETRKVNHRRSKILEGY